jgi:hypothetical protein
MKRFIIAFLLFVPLLGSAQTKSDIFNPKVPLVFFGADFSLIQFTKSDEFNNKPEILRLFVDLNNVLQYKAYQNILNKRLRRSSIENDISYVTNINAAVDWQTVYSDNVDYRLSDADIENMIKRLNIKQEPYKDHIGMILCEENYCKTKPLGTVALVFFTVNDLKPILIKHYSFKPSGYGFLNYWAMINYMAIYNLKKLYKEIM